jgi:hypothetical protein
MPNEIKRYDGDSAQVDGHQSTALDRHRTQEQDPQAEIAEALWNGEIASRIQSMSDAIKEFAGTQTSPIEQAQAFFAENRELAHSYFELRTLDDRQYSALQGRAFRRHIDSKLQQWQGSQPITLYGMGGWSVMFKLGGLAPQSGQILDLNCGAVPNLNHYGKEDTDRNFELQLGSFYGSNITFAYDDSRDQRSGYGSIKTGRTEKIGNQSRTQVKIEVFPRPFVDLMGQKSKEYALERSVDLNDHLLTKASYGQLTAEGQVTLQEMYVLDPDSSKRDGYTRWFGTLNPASGTIEWRSGFQETEAAGGWKGVVRKMFGGGKAEKGPSTVKVTVDKSANAVVYSVAGGEVTRVPITTNVLDAIPSGQMMSEQLAAANRPQLPGSES